MAKKHRAIRRSKGEVIFEVFNLTILTLITFACLFPFLNTLANSFSSDAAIAAGKVSLWPVGWQFDSFRFVAVNKSVLRSLGVTVTVAVVGTAINMFMTIITAYPLSRKDLKGRGMIMNYIIITMLFNGGMIPTFLLVKSLHLLNSLWGIILPTAISTFNLIVLKTFFEGVPYELQEAATIDGCSNMRILFQIIVPLSIPAIATLTLFYAVAHWNNYFNPMLYINDPKLYTLQMKLRQLLLQGRQAELTEGMESVATVSEESLKAATIIFSTLPILLFYPWLQKYFVKGVTIGAIKG